MGILDEARKRIPAQYLYNGGAISRGSSIAAPITAAPFEEVSYNVSPYDVEDYASGHYPIWDKYTTPSTTSPADNTIIPTTPTAAPAVVPTTQYNPIELSLIHI